MDLSVQYKKLHYAKDLYSDQILRYGYSAFRNRQGWTDYIIDNNLIYSHRINGYTKKNFTEGLHTHEYYELVVYINGNINYITDNYVIKPKPYSVIWFLPGQMHTATLLSESEYDRYVFYFTKDFFTLNGTLIPMTDFLSRHNSNVFFPDNTCTSEIRGILNNIDSRMKSKDACSGLVAKALITELFGFFNSTDMGVAEQSVSKNLSMEIKNYIDTEYACILKSEDIAKRFHYSREHISRNFKNTFNISISDYIAKRRVLESLPLLNEMLSSRAAYEVGFKSQSAYISAFVKNMGCLPTEYKKRKKEK